MPLTPQEREDQKSWYSTKEVEQLVFDGVHGNPEVTALRCKTSPAKLTESIREFDSRNPGSDKSLAIPFLLEGEGGRNHFYTIFREKDPATGNFVFTVHDSNDPKSADGSYKPIPPRLENALKQACPGVEVNQWHVKQQANNIDCGPHAVNNLLDMANAKKANPDQLLTPDVLSVQIPRDMQPERAQHTARLKELNRDSGEAGVDKELKTTSKRLADAQAEKDKLEEGAGASNPSAAKPKKKTFIDTGLEMAEAIYGELKKLLDPTRPTPGLATLMRLFTSVLVWALDDSSSKGQPSPPTSRASRKHSSDGAWKTTINDLKVDERFGSPEDEHEGGRGGRGSRVSVSGGSGNTEKSPNKIAPEAIKEAIGKGAGHIQPGGQDGHGLSSGNKPTGVEAIKEAVGKGAGHIQSGGQDGGISGGNKLTGVTASRGGRY